MMADTDAHETKPPCMCLDWQENIGFLNSMLLLKWNHGGKGYEGKPFVYCPWCGQPLQVIKSDVLAEQTARRTATRWLVEYVGNMLVADGGRLLESEDRTLWRFGAFITGPGHRPWGPIGHLDVDAHTGDLLLTENLAQEMMASAETLIAKMR
jgi:hypothetical protein